MITRNSLDNEKDVDKAYEIVKDHNLEVHGIETINHTKSFYVIGLTGKEVVCYTLYRSVFVDGKFTGYQYMRNLSHSLLKSVEKISTKRGLPILIDNEFSRGRQITEPLCFRIGKHKGENINDVFEEDRNYVRWFVNNWNAKTKHDKELREQGKNLFDAYYQMITEENKENCTSEYVGTLKKRDDYNLKVTHVKGHYDSLKISCVDKDGNKIFFFYSGDIEVKVDDEFSLRGTPVDHKEILGIKWTRINRVKFQ